MSSHTMNFIAAFAIVSLVLAACCKLYDKYFRDRADFGPSKNNNFFVPMANSQYAQNIKHGHLAGRVCRPNRPLARPLAHRQAISR